MYEGLTGQYLIMFAAVILLIKFVIFFLMARDPGVKVSFKQPD